MLPHYILNIQLFEEILQILTDAEKKLTNTKVTAYVL